MKGRKKHILLVDGYNIINSWPELIEAQSISLDAAREELIDKMAELAGITGEILMLVFDSYLQKNATRQHLKRKGIEIFQKRSILTFCHLLCFTLSCIKNA